jgi:Cu(I)/Ag(I) efflux system membrane protein CusA/SilA
MEHAEKKLRIVIPLTLALIFLLLYLTFHNIVEPAIIMLTVPFGLVGGIWLIYLLGFNLSIAVYVGFIALAGTAAETGVMVLNFIDLEIAQLRRQKQARLSVPEIKKAVETAAVKRVRPVTITAFSTMIGLIPIMMATGSGADVAHRIAAPVLGGMFTVLILSLLVFPVIYSLVLQFQEKHKQVVIAPKTLS